MTYLDIRQGKREVSRLEATVDGNLDIYTWFAIRGRGLLNETELILYNALVKAREG